MYLPDRFCESRPERWLALLADHRLGTVVSLCDGLPCANHYPLLWEHTEGGALRLCGHMARANPQWRCWLASPQVLVVVLGPHGYVSPSWYESPGVPTWNYAAVHLRGEAGLIEDRAALAALLARATEALEAELEAPWRADLESGPEARLLEKVVGFEIRVHEVQAKLKLSQNRTPADRAGVIAGLRRRGRPADLALAALMETGLD